MFPVQIRFNGESKLCSLGYTGEPELAKWMEVELGGVWGRGSHLPLLFWIKSRKFRRRKLPYRWIPSLERLTEETANLCNGERNPREELPLNTPGTAKETMRNVQWTIQDWMKGTGKKRRQLWESTMQKECSRLVQFISLHPKIWLG